MTTDRRSEAEPNPDDRAERLAAYLATEGHRPLDDLADDYSPTPHTEPRELPARSADWVDDDGMSSAETLRRFAALGPRSAGGVGRAPTQRVRASLSASTPLSGHSPSDGAENAPDRRTAPRAGVPAVRVAAYSPIGPIVLSVVAIALAILALIS